ncbi:MAG TPA: serine hydrolase, partial [Acidimicrobiia bacterium]|nr:serine hydrolase [Acidimicrobiia bacterium]
MSHPCHRILRCAIAFGAGLLLAATAAVPAGAQTGPQSAEPKAWIVVDADTGEVIAGKNVHDAVPPASTAKIVTALVAMERYAPDAMVTVSARAAGVQASADNPIRLQPGEQWRFADLLAIVMLLSGNDASYAIAEQTAGSVESFADAMNVAARRMGMRDSTFNDPAGFSDATAFDGGPRASAFDLAIATRNA